MPSYFLRRQLASSSLVVFSAIGRIFSTTEFSFPICQFLPFPEEYSVIAGLFLINSDGSSTNSDEQGTISPLIV